MVTRFLLLLLTLWLSFTGTALAKGEVRLQLLYDHHKPVVSEMVEITIRGEYDLTVSLEEMVFPNSPDYDWIQTARDDWHKERVNGRLLQIFERKVAVFPSHDGEIKIGPVVHRLTYVTEDGQRGQLDVTAPEITLNVLPFPGDHRPLSASKLTLTDELSAKPGQLRQNEILTRRVTIEAQGTLGHYLPPRPDLSQPWMISFTAPELRETTITDNDPLARVVWEWQLRPHTGEPAILPGTGFAWFDSTNRQVKIAPLDPIPFGFVGFGANFGNTAGGDEWRNNVLSMVVLLVTTLAGLILLLWRSSPLQRDAMLTRLRRMLPSPYRRAMVRAAEGNNLPALREAAARDLNWRGSPDAKRLADLDRQLYAKQPPAGFDPMKWLAGFRSAGK